MSLVERLKEMNTGVLLAIAAGVVVVGGILLVALMVVLAAVVGSFVLGVGEEVETSVQAGASVQPDADASEVAIVWTSNQNAEHLLVEWTVSEGALDPPVMDGDATAGERQARLSSVGSSVVLPAADPGTDTTVAVTVTAVDGDERVVVDEREVTV